MTTLTKIIVTTLLSLLFFSCNFDINLNPGVTGNGNVIEETRSINETYNAIKVSEGLNVYVTQSDHESIVVEADDNLQDLIIVEVVDQVLKIHTKQNIGKASAKKVHVSFKNISGITATSGSTISSTNTIKAENLELNSSSGSHMTLDVSTNKTKSSASSGSHIGLDINTSFLECHSSSGSHMKLTGKTINLIAEASSGSHISGNELISESSEVDASSGSNITVNTSKKLVANAHSGASINYYGNPESIEQNKSKSGGSVSKK